MMGFMQWFKSSNKMKRWIFLILIGILLACYGISEVLILKELSFSELIKIILAFVIGFVSIVLGLVFLNKRTLEVLIESTDDRMENRNNINIKSLIFDKKIYDQGPNIVVIGGGSGLNTVLTGLKRYTNNLTAVVTVSDYGEAESESKKELELMPIDDIKDSIISLSSNGEQIEKLFDYKFRTGKLKNITFADIYFSAMKEVNNDFADSITKSNEVLNIIGKVLPVTLDKMNITAELQNGYIVTEKSRIPKMVYEKVTKINRIYLNPSNCRPAPGVIEAIKNADCIIIGPGSLYTNVIPNLLVNGVAKAIKEASALKVYISNIMTEPGQTDEYSVSDHLNAIIEHCGRGVVDFCIYDTGEVVPEFIKKYNLQGQDLVEPNIDKVKGITYLQRNLSRVTNGCVRHDPELVAESVIELICDDLKYQDKQNDPQYLMLNNKLKEDKRINKIKKKMKKERNKEKMDSSDKQKRKSKFSNKYSDRIASIQESDKMIRIKEEMQRRQARKRKNSSSMKQKSSKLKKKTPQQIREEMLRKLENTKFKSNEDE